MEARKGLIRRLTSFWIPEQEIRAEAWALGGRHLGRVIEGAQLEAKFKNLPFRRAILLQAVIRDQRRVDRLKAKGMATVDAAKREIS